MLRSSIAHATTARSSGTLIRFKGAPRRRCLATVSSSIIIQPPHPPPPPASQGSLIDADVPPLLDARVLQAAARQHQTPISDILKQYVTASGTVLDMTLPYEACPAPERRPHIADPGESAREVVTVAHVARDGLDHKVTLASGFVLNAMAPRVEGQDEEAMVLTCAHTLEELRQWPLLEPATRNPRTKQASGSFVVVGAGTGLQVFPVSRVLSALPLSDLLLLSCPMPPESVRALPVSPYPAHRDTPILAHFVSHGKPKMAGWNQWIGDTWGKWEKGKVVGYRDFAGRETQPGTYDALSHLLFTPLPTAGSSGGPIIDEETGAVVGVMLGTRTVNSIEGMRGWGASAETIFEVSEQGKYAAPADEVQMFSLPGLEGKK